MNPFGYVNSLYTYAREIAELLSSGKDVAALIGPYSADELLEQIGAIRGEVSTVQKFISSQDVSSGNCRDLITIDALEESLVSLRQRCRLSGAQLRTAPTGVSGDELSGYGIALSSGIKSEVYRSVVLRLASCLCGGSVDCYRSIVEEYAGREEQSGTFLNPYTLVAEYGKRRLQQMTASHTYREEQVCSFLEALASLALGAQLPASEVQAIYRWAWSLGFCWREDGIWHIDWAIIMYAIDLPSGHPLVENGRINSIMKSVYTRRVGSAETSAIMPVLERYCSAAASRYICESMREDGTWLEETELNRSTEIGAVRQFQNRHPGKWPAFVNDSVSMLDVCLLRNGLCHLDPSAHTSQLLATLRRVIDVLTMHDEKPYSCEYSCVFL